MIQNILMWFWSKKAYFIFLFFVLCTQYATIFAKPLLPFFDKQKSKIEVESENFSTFYQYFLRNSIYVRREFPSINPDEPVIGYSFHEGLWNAMIGRKFVLYYLNLEDIEIAFIIGSFFHLHNFSTHKVEYPWEIWRLGISFLLDIEWKFLNRIIFQKYTRYNRLYWQIGILHESHHIANLSDFIKRFTTLDNNIQLLNNGNLRALEFAQISLLYLFQYSPFYVGAGVTFKYHLPTHTARGHARNYVEYGASIEVQLGIEILYDIVVYLSYYHESIFVNYNKYPNYTYLLSVEKENDRLVYNIIEVSLDLKRFVKFHTLLYGGFNASHGRGFDFINFYKNYFIGIKTFL